MKVVTHSRPQGPVATQLCPGRLKQRAAELLHLVNKKSKQHQVHEDSAQMLFAQAIVMPEVIPLIFQGIEGLVLNPSAGTTTTHDFHDVVRGDLKIGDPAEPIADNSLFAFGFHFPLLKEVDEQLALTGLVERDSVDESKTVCGVSLAPVWKNQLGHLAPLGCGINQSEHVGMIPWFGREDVTEIMGHQVFDVRRV